MDQNVAVTQTGTYTIAIRWFLNYSGQTANFKGGKFGLEVYVNHDRRSDIGHQLVSFLGATSRAFANEIDSSEQGTSATPLSLVKQGNGQIAHHFATQILADTPPGNLSDPKQYGIDLDYEIDLNAGDNLRQIRFFAETIHHQ